MEPKEFLNILSVAEKLKCNTRHCWTSTGRPESVAEHSWRVSLMAMLLSGEEEFRDLDMNRVIRMCLIHDLGEAITGDIPTFWKESSDVEKEDAAYDRWVESFPEAQKAEFRALLAEMAAMETREARLYKALDKMEAIIQHNEADLSTWLPLEYDLQLTYGREQMEHFSYMRAMRAEVDDWTREKIAKG